MPVKSDREYRSLALLPDEEKEMVVRGYATTFGQPYELYRDDEYILLEQVDRNAFDGAEMSDVIMQYNHEGRVFARVKNNTLSLQPDEHGLLIEADLGHTELGRQLYEEIRGGYTDKMSFGFTVTKDSYEEKETNGLLIVTRTIEQIGKLFDVSAVSIPANDATSISVRSLSDGVIERVKAERLEAQMRERELYRTQLRLRLMR